MSKTKKLVTLSLLAAVALALFTVELLIPPITPFPWVKIGLANIITLFVLYRKEYTAYNALSVVIVRVLLAGLITGSPISLLFSFTGGVASLLAMVGLRKLAPTIPATITSVAGALTHNLAQIIVAVFVYGGFGVLLYLPGLVLGGIISGLITGFAIAIILRRMA